MRFSTAMPRMTSWSKVSPPFCWRVTPAVLRSTSYTPVAPCSSITSRVTVLTVAGTSITDAPRNVPASTVSARKPLAREASTLTVLSSPVSAAATDCACAACTAASARLTQTLFIQIPWMFLAARLPAAW
ncbi:hypothetical protein D3C72_1710570 [compost metagenome]